MILVSYRYVRETVMHVIEDLSIYYCIKMYKIIPSYNDGFRLCLCIPGLIKDEGHIF